jgi:hypothetical protein
MIGYGEQSWIYDIVFLVAIFSLFAIYVLSVIADANLDEFNEALKKQDAEEEESALKNYDYDKD